MLWTVAECTIGICCVSVPPMRPLFSRLLPDVFLTRRTPYNRTEAAARRQAYAMAGWSGPSTPTDEENKSSEVDLAPSVVAGEEQIPKSWLGGEDHRPVSTQGAALGRSATLTVREIAHVISPLPAALQKG